jgi:catechol 2,3-dioxygenase-like lactoylglutathione lyase family enzyme
VGAVVGLQEVVLWVRDLDRALEFYSGLFGLEPITPPGAPRAFLRAGDDIAGIPQVIVLVPHPDPAHEFPTDETERPLHHFAFVADPAEFDDLRAALTAAGIQTRDGVHPILQGVRTYYLDDPEGNEVEVIATDAEAR